MYLCGNNSFIDQKLTPFITLSGKLFYVITTKTYVKSFLIITDRN